MRGKLEIELVQYKLQQRFAKVISVTDLSPSLRRIQFGGLDLLSLPFDRLAPDLHVKLFFPEDPWDAANKIKMPVVQRNGEADWYGVRDGRFSDFRDYTVRSFNAQLGQIEIDFVLHETGVGGPWASQAKVGQMLGVLGPRILKRIPTHANQYIFFADETGLPALARWLEILPLECSVWAAIEVSGYDGIIHLPERPNTTIHWLPRNEQDCFGELLLSYLDHLPSIDALSWCWGACEASTVVELKKRMLALGFCSEYLDLKAYWKREKQG